MPDIRKIKIAPRVRPTQKKKTTEVKRRKPLEQQFDEKYVVTDIYPTLINGEKAKTPCWRWIGANNGKGSVKSYGIFSKKPKWYAHRYSYTRFIGPIPDGLVIDHRCRHRWCV